MFLAAVDGRPTFWPYCIVFIPLVNTVISLYYYLLILKAMYINNDGEALPTFKMDGNTKLTLVICTAGVMLFGVVSCIYEALHSAAAA